MAMVKAAMGALRDYHCHQVSLITLMSENARICQDQIRNTDITYTRRFPQRRTRMRMTFSAHLTQKEKVYDNNQRMRRPKAGR